MGLSRDSRVTHHCTAVRLRRRVGGKPTLLVLHSLTSSNVGSRILFVGELGAPVLLVESPQEDVVIVGPQIDSLERSAQSSGGEAGSSCSREGVKGTAIFRAADRNTTLWKVDRKRSAMRFR